MRLEKMNIPRKQGRMFQLNLGQNDGPFKMKQLNGCPQVDKFATYSMNSILNNKVSPRIGILGASTFPTDLDFVNSGMAAGNSQMGVNTGGASKQ
mmetsp:Transcript_8522/g.14368  ORF Transcript_8522/g.14368 Transcript_8522/m.14368 type:complete len:95 (-) Transcript_8522:1044-1328(-)